MPVLEAVLSDDSIIKAGVGINEDMMELSQCWGGRLVARSRLNLGDLGTTGYSLGIKRMARGILGLDVPKGRKMATRNWAQLPLTDSQLAYCGRDAWVGAAVVDVLADRAPEVFSPDAIRSMLAAEPPVQELCRRARLRKRAKMQFKSLISTWGPTLENAPEADQAEATRLRRVMRDLAPPRTFEFDATSLGFPVSPDD